MANPTMCNFKAESVGLEYISWSLTSIWRIENNKVTLGISLAMVVAIWKLAGDVV